MTDTREEGGGRRPRLSLSRLRRRPVKDERREDRGRLPIGSSLRHLPVIITVLVVPFLVASFLSDDASSPDREAKVTRILRQVSGTDPSDRQGGADGGGNQVRDDVPVTGGKAVGITFVRGRRTSVGTLEIPAIELKTKFFEGVVDEAVEKGPGHWPGTPFPGAAGNSVFAGHRTTFTHPFGDLDLLSKGDRVVARVADGSPVTYRVFRMAVVPEAEYVDYVLEQPQSKTARIITLFACAPKGSRTHRIVVQAKASPVGRTTRESEAVPLSRVR